jgi:hypothetical protein
MPEYDPRAAFTHALMRAGAESVEFPDDDAGHIYVRMRGATEILRYRLGTEAQQFLAGEFPTLPAERVAMRLLVPKRPYDPPDDDA